MSELAKWSEAMEDRVTVESFLEWLQEQRIVLASWGDGSTPRWPLPITESRNDLLNRYFHIDAKALESERRALLSRP